MPRLIYKRRVKQTNLEPDRFTERRIAEIAQERCDRCWNLWPASMITLEDGLHVCPNDVDTTTAEWRKRQEEAQAAYIERSYTKPQPHPPTREVIVAVTGMADSDGNEVRYGRPLSLVASGAAEDLVLTGVNLSASDTVSADAGITVSVTVDSTTQVTLSVSAGAMAAGDYALTYNDTVYRGVFRVR
jgi:hypothetical protein